MEKSFAKTDQIRAKAAAVTATKPAIPARRAVSAKRSGEKFPGIPLLRPGNKFGACGPAVASIRKASAPASRLYAASANAMRRERLPKAAMGTPTRFSHASAGGEKLPGKDVINSS